jgi:Ice-binding-like
MNNAIIQTRSIIQCAMRGAIFLSISLAVFLFSACETNEPSSQRDAIAPTGLQNLKKPLSKTASITVPLGSLSAFTVLGATTVTNDGASLITGNLGVSPGTAITGFQPTPLNTISGPGTVTAGLGIVKGTIYAAGPVAAQAHNDAVIMYNSLVAQVPDTTYSGVTQLNGLTFTPGVYRFAPSANLQVNGTLYLDFQGNSDAQFIFQMGTTLVTMAGSNVVAVNNNSQSCSGSNVFWAVGSSATIDGAQFIGSVVATTTITMTSDANVTGRILALNGAVTLITDTIAVCNGSSGSGGGGGVPPEPCRDFVTGGGWIKLLGELKDHKDGKATFGVSGGIKNGEFWGELSYNDHDGMKVKSTSVTDYIVIDSVTRQIDGIAKVNEKSICTYTVVLVDNGEPGRNDSFSLTLSNGYSASGKLIGGNIQLHTKCGESHEKGGRENYHDIDEEDGIRNCDNN